MTLRFNADTTSGSAPLSTTFTIDGTNTILSSTWDFGDGFISADASPNHSYNCPGVYDVTLTAKYTRLTAGIHVDAGGYITLTTEDNYLNNLRNGKFGFVAVVVPETGNAALDTLFDSQVGPLPDDPALYYNPPASIGFYWSGAVLSLDHTALPPFNATNDWIMVAGSNLSWASFNGAVVGADNYNGLLPTNTNTIRIGADADNPLNHQGSVAFGFFAILDLTSVTVDAVFAQNLANAVHGVEASDCYEYEAMRTSILGVDSNIGGVFWRLNEGGSSGAANSLTLTRYKIADGTVDSAAGGSTSVSGCTAYTLCSSGTAIEETVTMSDYIVALSSSPKLPKNECCFSPYETECIGCTSGSDTTYYDSSKTYKICKSVDCTGSCAATYGSLYDIISDYTNDCPTCRECYLEDTGSYGREYHLTITNCCVYITDYKRDADCGDCLALAEEHCFAARYCDEADEDQCRTAFTFDGKTFVVTGTRGECVSGTDCGDCWTEPTNDLSEPFEGLPDSLSSCDVESTENAIIGTEVVEEPETIWHNKPSAETDLGSTCTEESLLDSEAATSLQHSDVECVPAGHVIIVYEERSADGMTKINAEQKASSVKNRVVHYRSLGYGQLVNDANVYSSGQKTFKAFDNIDTASLADDWAIGFKSGPLAGRVYLIDEITAKTSSSPYYYEILFTELKYPEEEEIDFEQVAASTAPPTEESFYNTEYFILDTGTEDEVSALGDIPQHTANISPYEVPCPSSYPSICVAHNNKRTGSNDQFMYIAYQAFVAYKWQIYLRQIRLSPSAIPVLPIYAAPYDNIGLIDSGDITTLWTRATTGYYANLDSTGEIDSAAGKIYWFFDNIIYRANTDGTVEETLYTYSDGDPGTTDTIEDLKLDTSASTYRIFFVTKSVSGSSSYHRLFKANPADIAGTRVQLYSYSSGNNTSVKISVSNDYVYSSWSETDYIYRQLKSGGDVTTIATSADTVILSACYSDNKLYILNTASRLISVYDSTDGETTSLYTAPSNVLTTNSTVTSSSTPLYISDSISGNLASWDFDSKCVEYRLKGSTITKSIVYDTFIYWAEKSGGNVRIRRATFDALPSQVLFKAVDLCTLNCPDTLAETYISRVKYELHSNNDKLIFVDSFGYYDDVTVEISYKGDLAEYWHDTTLFDFTNDLPNSTGSNVTNLPFEKDTSNLFLTGVIYLKHNNSSKWRLVDSSGELFLTTPGQCGVETGEPILIAASDGHCTRPRIASSYNNDLFITYEDNETGRPQIKIKGTGYFNQNSFIGSNGSYVADFFKKEDFRFIHEITEGFEGMHQLADLAVDKSNIIHVVWQSNINNYWEIYYANSSSCFYPVRITESASRSLSPSIEVNGNGSIYVAYHDDRFGKNQILVSYKDDTRVLPLLQQDNYLASKTNGYIHYVNYVTVPVKNDTDTSRCIHLRVKFFDTLALSGDPTVILSTIEDPDLFQVEGETAHRCEDGSIYVPAFSSVDVSVMASRANAAFSNNHTYFIGLEYLYNNLVVQNNEEHISYSCLTCNRPSEKVWYSSFYGSSDTRITDSTDVAVNPRAKIKANKLAVVWEDYRSGSSKVLGSFFNSQGTNDNPNSSGGNWFDYDFRSSGKNPSFAVDLFDRLIVAYDKENQDGTSKTLPVTKVAYKVCNFDLLPDVKSVASSEAQIGDYSAITENVVSDDPLVSEKYVKKINVMSDYVDYYTRNLSGNEIPVVSGCQLKLELFGTPEVMAYRIKNENETQYSKWYPFKPNIADYYTEIDHKLSPNPGVKEVCVQVATYSGITLSFYLTIIADYDTIPYDVVLTKTDDKALPVFNDSYVASTINEDKIDIHVYIVVPDYVKLVSAPTFDLLQQGFNSVFGVRTTLGTLPENINMSGVVYKSVQPVSIYKEDGKFNKDGVAKIKPRFESECISEYYNYQAPAGKDDYNYFGEAVIAESSITSDVLSTYRNSQTGKVGIVPDADTNEDEIFQNLAATSFSGSGAVDVAQTADLEIWRTTGYSISLWMKTDGATNAVLLSESSAGGTGLQIATDATGEKLSFTISGTAAKTSTTTIGDDKWHNIVLVDDNGTVGIYIDGERESMDFDYDSSLVNTTLFDRTTIGSRYTAIGYAGSFDGIIDEVASWNVALLPSDVETIYNSGSPTILPKEENLIFWNRMGDKFKYVVGIQRLRDETTNNNYGTLHGLDFDNNIVGTTP